MYHSQKSAQRCCIKPDLRLLRLPFEDKIIHLEWTFKLSHVAVVTKALSPPTGTVLDARKYSYMRPD